MAGRVGNMSRRSFKDVLAGFAAIVVLLALIAGVPYALATFIGWPLPRELPNLSLETLRSPVDASTLVNLLALVVWLAWAQFTACVVIEVWAAAAGAGMPAKVPLGGLNQVLARQLVAAVLLLSSTAVGLAPGRAGLAGGGGLPQRPAARAVTVQAAAQQGTAAHHGAGAAAVGDATGAAAGHPPAAVAAQAAGGRKVYVVRPPQGRHHESLWEIAERHLGDGRRYREIYELNQGREQPGGERLSLASLIRPGWTLDMPADAVGVEIFHEQATSAAPPTGGGSHRAGAGGSDAAGPEIAAPQAAPAPSPLAYELSGASLLDLGLRALSASLGEAGRPLPTVYAARLDSQGLQLLLAPAEPQAPEPWVAVAGGAMWRLPAAAGATLDERAVRDVLA